MQTNLNATSLNANKSVDERNMKFCCNIMKIPSVQLPFCSKFQFPRFSISILIIYSLDMCCSQLVVLYINEFPYKMHFIVNFS